MSWHDADFSVSFFIFYRLRFFYKISIFTNILLKDINAYKHLLTKQKEKGKFLKAVFVKA